MKIDIENLGAITNKAEIDLKPLSVFIGEKRITLERLGLHIQSPLFFLAYSYDIYTTLFNSDKLKDKYPIIENSIEEVLEKGNTQIDLLNLFDKNLNQYLNNITRICKIGLKDFFRTDYASFEEVLINIDISNEIPAIKNNLINMKYQRSLSPNSEGKSKLKFFKEKKDHVLHIYSETSDKEKRLPKQIIKNFIYERAFFLMHYCICHNTYIFPSERTGFSTISLENYPKGSMGAIRKEYNKDLGTGKSKLTHSISLSTGRVLDIMHKFLTIESQEEHLKKRIENKNTRKFVEYANLYQNFILHGSLNKSKPINKNTELLFIFDNKIELDMNMVSSIVKASSPIIIYLKFFAQKGELIIIDEPEMNLHPNSAQYAEFLGLLINSGLRIIITTHINFLLIILLI